MSGDTVKIDWNRRARESIVKQQGDKSPEDVEELEIYDNITDLSLFAPFKNLKVLRIDQAGSPVARLRSLSGLPALPQLRELQVADHLLSELPADFAARFPNLAALLITNNKFDSIDLLKPLFDCKSLHTLEVDDNSLVSKCKKEGVAYRDVLFGEIASLKVIDGKDKDGNDVAESESEGEDEGEVEDDEEVKKDAASDNENNEEADNDDDDDDDENEEDEEHDEEETEEPTSPTSPAADDASSAKRKRDADDSPGEKKPKTGE
ncbi:Acidic leucine-rich nuclear phosphoprotein 32-related protein 2 [Diplonema papillatum]|nr:Acidic leucine-rich nuclear phosphoprotein 32-related protein 2 [Diplonema papillatum]